MALDIAASAHPAPEHPASVGRVVTVLGMHRSGTSALTRVLHLLGADLGPTDALIPPAPDNPRGFWENRPLVLAADRILALFGGTWDAPPELPEGWVDQPLVAAVAPAAGEIFDRLAPNGADVLAVKDPRTCLLLPFWRQVITSRTVDHRVLHVLRSPDEVVGSLQRRDGMDTEHAARLWVRYVRDAFDHAPEAPRIFQDELFAATSHAVSRLVELSGLDAPSTRTEEEIERFLDVGLQTQRHHRAPDGPWVRLARQMYRQAHDGAPATGIVATADRQRARLLPQRGAASPTVVTGSTSPPSWVLHRLRDTIPAGRVAAWNAPHPRMRYAAEALGWEVVDVAPPAVVPVIRPSTVVVTDAATGRDVASSIVQHAPGTRLVATDDAGLDGVADAVIDAECPTRQINDALGASVDTDTPPAVASIPRVSTVPGRVSVVIPVYGGWDLTAACLDALQRTTGGHDLEIIVVDNASPDQTTDELARRADVDVVVVNTTNLGFAGGVNTGLKHATGEYVCILNNDTEPVAGWLDGLLDALATPGTGLVGPRTNRISGPQRIGGAPGFEQLDPSALHAWATDWVGQRPAAAWSVPRLVGFCLLARRTLFEELGGLDAGVGIGNYEDDELSARVRAAGMTCRVAERSVVLHHGSATFARTDVDYLGSLLKGARHTHGRLRPVPDTVTAVVLSDEQGVDAATTAAAALQVVDGVQIWERGEIMPTRRAAAGLPAAVDVVAVDWQDDDRAGAALDRIESAGALVLGAGERLRATDQVLARMELETATRAGLAGPGGVEIRLVPTTSEAVRAVGSSTTSVLRCLTLA